MKNNHNKIILLFVKIPLFLVIFLMFFSLLQKVQAAAIDFSSPSLVDKKTKEFSVDLTISSLDQVINAVSGEALFPVDKVKITSISQSDSIFNFWIKDPVVSELGVINFEGVIFNPGFVGPYGKILTIKFKLLDKTPAEFKIISGLVLANDGQGTDVPVTLGNKSVNIKNK